MTRLQRVNFLHKVVVRQSLFGGQLAIESQAGERYGWSHFRSLAEHQLGHLEQAESLYRRCIDECQRTGDRRLEIFMRSGLAALLADRGLVDRATRKAEPDPADESEVEDNIAKSIAQSLEKKDPPPTSG